jgi:HSP20 family protein
MNTLTRFNPLGEISRFDPFMEADDLFDRLARTALRPAWRDWEATEPLMRMDVYDAGNEYLLKAEIPGVKKDDIHVSIEGNMVSISAEFKQETETHETSRMLRSERCYGKTMRTFRLDQEVIEDKAKAKYTDGVLELRLPKKNVAPHREVTIS